MGLSLLDCVCGTVVDHRYERRPDGKEKLRPKVRRGIIVKVEGEASSGGGVPAVHVKFSKDGDPERLDTAELSRYLPARAKAAREAYRRIMGQPKMVGLVTQAVERVPVVMVDELSLTQRKNAGPVQEEEEGGPIDGMDLPDPDEAHEVEKEAPPESSRRGKKV